MEVKTTAGTVFCDKICYIISEGDLRMKCEVQMNLNTNWTVIVALLDPSQILNLKELEEEQ
jgi:hypothetical protein